MYYGSSEMIAYQALLFARCLFTVITLQDWVSWGIFTVIRGHPHRANGDTQHLEAHPELRDWLRFEKITGQRPFFGQN